MQIQRFMLVLTVANFGALVFALLTMWPVGADNVPAVLRGRALEIVDDQGRVRASLSVLSAGTSPKGESYHETVLFRLITERGRPSVKIGSSEESAGISLAGPTGTSNTYVILEARGTSSSLKLRNESGHEQVVRP